MTGRTMRAGIYLTIFALITGFLTYVLAVTIANGTVGSTQTYRAQFTDATGLLAGDDVRVAGVRVGQVQSVHVAHECRDGASTLQACAEVTFGLDKQVVLHTSAKAALRYRNLIGQRYLEILDSPGADAPAPDDYQIPLARTTPALDLTALFDGFKPLFEALDPGQINQVAYEVVRTLQGEGGTIDTLLTSTASLSTSVAAQDAAVGSLITNLTGVLGTVDQRRTELTTLVDQLQRLVTGLAGDHDAIASSLTHVNDLATSTSRLIAAIRPDLPSDLAQLSAVANTLATSTGTLYGPKQNQLEAFLQHLPGKINAITRTASYGSWFNFYLCSADIALGGLPGPTVQIRSTNTNACVVNKP
ncbi:MAG TPA: MlaD family protein [Mycobacteriales bacterium]|jgi:phospholipid/cholesterol/gamma-HCH transport system substrate-binding protein|nr:MlaD family protein [Mycobacteriales bacterium]